VKLVRSRLVAGALGLAVAGTTTGAVIARADDSAPRAQAAQSTGGVSITPAVIETTAKRGKVGAFTVKNTTKDTLRVTVTVRPWVQNRSTAAVAVNKTANLSPYVVGSPSSFTLKPGSRNVTLKMRRLTSAGSLYGGIEVFAKRTKPAKTGINPQWDLVSKLRLNAARKNPNLRVGATDVVGRGDGRSLILAVRNIGNTLDPVSGTVAISGPTPRNATIPQVSVVPGQVVYLKGGALRGMKAGNYTGRWTVTIGGKRFTVSRPFKL